MQLSNSMQPSKLPRSLKTIVNRDDNEINSEDGADFFLDDEAGKPGYQKDTIISFTSRAISRSIPRHLYIDRKEEAILKSCNTSVARTYLDPFEGKLRVRTPI